MHECVYHVQAKDGSQFLCVNGQFSKIQSQIDFIKDGNGYEGSVHTTFFSLEAVTLPRNQIRESA